MQDSDIPEVVVTVWGDAPGMAICRKPHTLLWSEVSFQKKTTLFHYLGHVDWKITRRVIASWFRFL